MNNNKVFYRKNNNITHKLTFGLPGSGISSIIKNEIINIVNNTKDDNIVIIDIYGAQFNEIIQKFKGVTITAKELLGCFNKIVFESLETPDNKNYDETFNMIVAILENLGSDYICPYQQSILYETLDDMWKSSEANTISNFIQHLRKKDNKLASILEILNRFPNYENNQDIMNKLNNRLVCFDLGDCLKEFKGLVYLLALKTAKDNIWKNGENQIYTCLFSQIDNAFLSEGICNYLLYLYKCMRQHCGISSLYTAKFSTFTNNHILTWLLINTNEFIFLKQNHDDVDKLSLYFTIPDTYSHFLKYADARQGIWTDGMQYDYVDCIHDFVNENYENNGKEENCQLPTT